ncbi:MAG: hypothetical protein M9893_00975 [Pyrinomonadaceae bacterium]|nr:hypothetical protein [Pyrinomonadaceae bacterium]
MEIEDPQTSWEVEVGGVVSVATLDELKEKIAAGTILPIDRVKKGNLRWIEAGKVPALLSFFNAAGINDASGPTITETSSRKTTGNLETSAGTTCGVHTDTVAAYCCGSCTNSFCKACPTSYGTTVKICPFCGAMCKPIDNAQQPKGQRLQLVHPRTGEKFGFGDLVDSFAYPFRHRASLILGATLFAVFQLGQMAIGIGGIAMFAGVIFAALLANALVFGVLANTIENFVQGKLDANFMPAFDDFSTWDDIIQPFFLSIGTYIISFGPFIAAVVVSFFLIMNTLTSEIDKAKADAARSVDPGIAYSINRAEQGEKLKKIVDQAAEAQKRRVEAMDRNEALPEGFDAQQQDDVIRRDRELQAIEQQQLEAAIKDAAKKQADQGFISKISGFGPVILIIQLVTLLWALFYFPAACAVAGYTRSFGAVINPAVGLDTIRRLGGSYVLLLVMTAVISTVYIIISGLIRGAFAAFELPMAGNIPAVFVSSLFAFFFLIVFSALLGRALYKKADVLELPT